MELNIKYMIRYFVLLILGMTLVIYGIVDIVSAKYATPPLSDKQIIQRAKDLGMVEMKDTLMPEMTND